MEENCAGSQGPQRAALHEELEEQEEATAKTFNMGKSAKS